ncbi:hypothetical protein [Mycobacteroides abscessus]|uniref:hypothetical protein n=1 Tax=Mycobacteroides abscessus TaxID=36809 RepID=UPI00092A040E|nr:hypothetical protein [Mycobacteroides abscessus]SIH83045.1 Uncharacterised protein [Mycobacteroides abscessus subsp. abscessus]SLI39687.1 Uncharacterised protein [Mycobacteroides abscessus subsp. abscessus]
MSHIPPAIAATADQLVAAADKTMPETGEAAKRLKLIEDAIGAEGQDAEDVAFLFAVAVKRLAVPRKEIQL